MRRGKTQGTVSPKVMKDMGIVDCRKAQKGVLPRPGITQPARKHHFAAVGDEKGLAIAAHGTGIAPIGPGVKSNPTELSEYQPISSIRLFR